MQRDLSALAALAAEVRELGGQNGLDAVGVAPAAPFERARRALEERRGAGLDGGMAFTYRNPARSTDPSRTVPNARAVVVGARSYLHREPVRSGGTHARVARYAWIDHYAPLRAGLWVIARRLRAEGWRAVVSADENSLVDREAAWLAGLGWFGKNANLLLPGRGSWFVLGGVITDAPLPAAEQPVEDGCGRCHRCIDACPTGAIIAPGIVDARRCLAWLVQAPGSFPREHRVALGDRIYGCDDCQEVCPPNRDQPSVHAIDPRSVRATVDLVELLSLSDAEVLRRHGHWYLWQRDPDQVRRNALIALGNSGDGTAPEVEAVLRCYLAHPRDGLRAHAAWASAQLGRRDLLSALVADPSAEVRAELERADALP